LLEGLHQAVHVPLGMGTYFEYLELLFGYRPRFAVRGLRSLGFGQTQARAAVHRVRTHVGPEASMERVLRQALAVVGRTRARAA